MAYDRNQDIKNVMASNPGMTASEAGAQIDRNSALNSQLTSAANPYIKQLEGSGLVKDLKKSEAVIKGQFGAVGEEYSIAKSPDAEAGSKKVGRPEDPFDETNIDAPKTVPPPAKSVGKVISGIVDTAKSKASSLVDELSAVGKNLAAPGGGLPEAANSLTSIAKKAAGNLPGDLSGLISADSVTASVDEQVKRYKMLQAKFASIDTSAFDPSTVESGLKKVADVFSFGAAKLSKLTLPTDKISAFTQFGGSSKVDIPDIPGFINPLSNIAGATLAGASKFLSPEATGAAASVLTTLVGAANKAGSTVANFANTRTISAAGVDPTKLLGQLPAGGGAQPAGIAGFLSGLTLKQTAIPSADSLGDTLPKAVKSADNRAQFFPADKLEANAKDMKANLEKQYSALGLPKIQEAKVTQADIDEARRLSAADIAQGKPENEWNITPQQVANNRSFNTAATAKAKSFTEGIANSGPANELKAQADILKSRLEARFGPAAARSVSLPTI